MWTSLTGEVRALFEENIMSGPQFFQTVMGQRFLEGAMPKIARALERIADALEAQNKTAPEAEPAYVLVEVKDGVAEVTRTSGKVEVALVDWDNIEAGDKVDEAYLQHAVFGPWIDADKS